MLVLNVFLECSSLFVTSSPSIIVSGEILISPMTGAKLSILAVSSTLPWLFSRFVSVATSVTVYVPLSE